MEEIHYIPFQDFVLNSGVKESTVKRRANDIPGLSKNGSGFTVISGTRYPFNIGNHNIKDSGGKRYTLLKAISLYGYISHRELRIEPAQFQAMLGDLIAAGLIRENGLCNTYGANAYDCTPKGDELIRRTDRSAKLEILNMIAEATGTFTGAVISQVYDAV